MVTGASGFVGRSFCEHLLDEGHRVVAVGRRPPDERHSEFRAWDLESPVPQSLLQGIDAVFHLAGRAHALAESAADEGKYDVVNRLATVRLADAVSQADVTKFVFVSSCKAIPPTTKSARDPYGNSKWLAEQAVLALSDRLHVSVIRPVLVYGPGCKGNLLQLIKALDSGRMPPLPPVENRRSLVGLHDLSRALRLAADNPRAAGRTLIVSDGQTYSTHRIVAALAAALGRTPPRARVPVSVYRAAGRLGDVAELAFRRRMPISTDVIEKVFGSAEYSSAEIMDLGFRPTEALEQVAPAMIEEYRRTRAG